MPRFLKAALMVAVLVAWVPTSCERHPEQKKQQESEAEEEQTYQSIMRLAESHNAVTDWRQPFLSDLSRGPVYTAELASALVRQDGRPIVFIGDVRDVEKEGDKIRLYFLTEVNDTTKALIVLDATQGQAAQVTAQTDFGLGYWAVVAQLESVRSLEAERALLPDDDKSAPPQSAAYGSCLGLLRVGAFYPLTHRL